MKKTVFYSRCPHCESVFVGGGEDLPKDKQNVCPDCGGRLYSVSKNSFDEELGKMVKEKNRECSMINKKPIFFKKEKQKGAEQK